MEPEAQLDMMQAWQEHVDSAISYTITLPNESEPEEVDGIFRGAHARRLKAIAVYRDGSRKDQPCTADGTCSM